MGFSTEKRRSVITSYSIHYTKLYEQELVDKVTKGGQLATSSMVPAMEGYTPAKGPAFNVEEARKLLAEAGFPDGKGFPKTPILYNTSDGHKIIAEWVQA